MRLVTGTGPCAVGSALVSAGVGRATGVRIVGRIICGVVRPIADTRNLRGSAGRGAAIVTAAFLFRRIRVLVDSAIAFLGPGACAVTGIRHVRRVVGRCVGLLYVRVLAAVIGP